ncbi:site-specific integrase [Mycobacteroides abscessus]|uniref:site-specific integrase n=1 Tax=Mycobacteroides abscessus TaxID=36809 RepID=UPI000926819D|nr:tyrosine-type recombinase/integrase [Mycobacteroides abscessus]SHX64296.1 Phage integrase [Mycobacteroides abscessus subsp. abscessus]SHZ18681.1 Phage integrase [Mycobacteroides abscessus subsp. abscessus]SIB50574.1 Phage integrase [Mycobacteroides abscessus subsp. abscessus]SIF19259.1 Phage integrase [Mycobacteroides abscessus subsp. abscessus]SKI48544.1 Phage integrase [Mycobacteroides abscessus subsp. abscessus]
MARPRLKIGQHGKIRREQRGTNFWYAHCYYRGLDGERRQAERTTPAGAKDKHGAAAVAALEEHLGELLGGGSGGNDDAAVTRDTLVSTLLERHLQALRDAEKAPRTIYSYGLRIGYWNAVASGITVGDCNPGRLNRHIEQVRKGHGDTDAKQLRSLLGFALDYAVNDGVLDANPARATKTAPTKKKSRDSGAQPLDPKLLPSVLKALLASEKCRQKDLTDPILMHLATGLRVSEVLGFQWAEFDPEAATITSTGRIVRQIGVGLLRTPTENSSKGTPDVIHLPPFAVAALLARAQEERPNKYGLIFPSAVGTMRDPSNFASQWRGVRDDLEHLAGTTGHSFRKTVGDLAADGSGDPRVAADVLGHRDVATTLRHYLSRGRQHPEMAQWIERAVTGKPAKKTAKPRTPKAKPVDDAADINTE